MKPGLPGHDGEAACKSFFQAFFLLQDFVFLLEGSQACPVMTGRLFASPFFNFFLLQDFVFLLERSQAWSVTTGKLSAGCFFKFFFFKVLSSSWREARPVRS